MELSLQLNPLWWESCSHASQCTSDAFLLMLAYVTSMLQQATHVVASLCPASRQPSDTPLPLWPTETDKVAHSLIT